MNRVIIHTDGACRGNPGPGGWAAVLRYGENEREISGALAETTNNRMELMAVIEALRALKRNVSADIYTDSRYVQQGISEWLPEWKRRGWRTASRKPVKNQDLWQTLDELTNGHELRWHWVKGHAGHPENERADALANQAIDRLLG
ncbi:MAG: ribonuclease HI [Steroidobacteraceae bacterium]